jgi:hypothetical protein
MVFILERVPASTEAASGQVSVFVHVKGSTTPVYQTEVILSGPETIRDFTDRNGSIIFANVSSGLYLIKIRRPGFKSPDDVRLDVESSSTTLTVELAPNSLKVISTVTVRSGTGVANSASERSVASRLSGDLFNGFGETSGVTVYPLASGANAFSLEGHDPGQTALSISGVPFNISGFGSSGFSISPDLFTRASASFEPTNGALGGLVNLGLPTTSRAFSLDNKDIVGTAGNSSRLIATGGFGNFQVALTQTDRSARAPLDGAEFADSSGESYAHAGRSVDAGSALTATWQASSEFSLKYDTLTSYHYSDALCNFETNGLPCGYGPGNFYDARASFSALTAFLTTSRLSAQLSLASSTSTNVSDFESQLESLALIPYYEFNTNHFNTAKATISSQANKWLRLSGSLLAQNANALTNATGEGASARIGTNNFLALRNDSLSAVATPTKFIELGSHIGNFAAGSSYGATGGADLTLHTPQGTSLRVEYSSDRQTPVSAWGQTLSPPQALFFDCSTGTAYGSAPADAPGRNSSETGRVSLTQQIRSGQLEISGYRQTVQGTSLYDNVADTSQITQTYLDNASSLATQECGKPTLIEANDIYFSKYTANLDVLYSGVRSQLALDLHPVQLDAYFDLRRDVLLSQAANLSPFSTIIPGRQLPGDPHVSAGITVDYRAPSSKIETLISEQYIGSNNGSNLPAHSILSAGLGIQSHLGVILLSAHNVLNAEAAKFGTIRAGVPLETINGTMLPQIGVPETPLTVNLTLSTRVGPRVPFDDRLGSAINEELRADSSVAGYDRVESVFEPLALRFDNNSLNVKRDSHLCNSDGIQDATALFNVIRSVIHDVELRKGVDGYPTEFQISSPLASLDIQYKKVKDSYVIEIYINDTSFAYNAVSCAHVHYGSRDQIEKDGLYVPSDNTFYRNPLIYSPLEGLYAAPATPNLNKAQDFRTLPLPTKAPLDPLGLVLEPRCTTDLRQRAAKVLSELTRYLSDQNSVLQAGDGLTIRPGQSPQALTLRSSDPGFLPAMYACTKLAAATPDELSVRGIVAEPLPSVNYTKSLGLFVIAAP